MSILSSGLLVELDLAAFEASIGGPDPSIPQWSDLQAGRAKPRCRKLHPHPLILLSAPKVQADAAFSDRLADPASVPGERLADHAGCQQQRHLTPCSWLDHTTQHLDSLH
ncbi:hypothetical protein K6M90_04640 [Rhizobium sp. 9T]|uniref:hypothetical protein n=1 Tax=Rhizobium croatiense TaxID=2867516 RepID=UPI001C932856|nr:hypothetical protein [Rhizobium croatiense]MBY4606956.1 hypothetical protein [Rhizobium croatiense]